MQNKYLCNEQIAQKVRDLSVNVTSEGLDELSDIIQLSLYTDSVVPMPMSDINGKYEFPDEGSGVKLKMEMIYDGYGNTYYPMYTDSKQLEEGRNSPVVVDAPIEIVLRAALQDEKSQGIVINPFTYDVFLPKTVIESIIDNYENPFSA